MTTRSLVASVAVTMGLLITAGLASRGHPLKGTAWSVSGRTADILMVVAFGIVAALIIALAIESHRPGSTARRQWGVGDVLFALVLVAALAGGSYGLGLVRHPSSGNSPQRGAPCVAYELAHGKPTSNCDSTPTPVTKRARPKAQGGSRASWFAIGTIVALLIGGAAAFTLERRRPSPSRSETDDGRRDAIVDALDVSIDDLRQEADARRAIIAAYARMEAAFTAAGLPRRPSEAPNEFLVRSLHELDASAEAASRLTELFELAKFSHHAATLTMRDEAIDALVAIRNELTEPELAATPTTPAEGSAVTT
jgi:hypothetical protein